jgi:four helix bundle protein
MSLKETSEKIYWLKVLNKAKLIENNIAEKILSQAEEIKHMLIASLNTAKANEY